MNPADWFKTLVSTLRLQRSSLLSQHLAKIAQPLGIMKIELTLDLLHVIPEFLHGSAAGFQGTVRIAFDPSQTGEDMNFPVI